MLREWLEIMGIMLGREGSYKTTLNNSVILVQIDPLSQILIRIPGEILIGN